MENILMNYKSLYIYTIMWSEVIVIVLDYNKFVFDIKEKIAREAVVQKEKLINIERCRFKFE